MKQLYSAAAGRRDPYWDNVKGVLILTVMLGHALEQAFKGLPLAVLPWTGIYSFHMPAFLMVSGNMVSRSSRDSVDRIPKMLGLYGVMCLVNAALKWVEHGFQEFRLNLLNPPYGCWYLLFLAYAYLTVHFLKGKNSGKVLGIALALALIRGFDATLTNTGGLVRFASYLIFFLLGYYLDLEELAGRLGRIPALMTFLALDGVVVLLTWAKLFKQRHLLGTVAYAELYPDHPLMGIPIQFLCIVTGMVLSMCLFAFTPRNENIFSIPGRNSLWIYLTHVVLVSRVFRWWTSLAIMNPETPRGTALALICTCGCMLLLIPITQGLSVLLRKH